MFLKNTSILHLGEGALLDPHFFLSYINMSTKTTFTELYVRGSVAVLGVEETLKEIIFFVYAK